MSRIPLTNGCRDNNRASRINIQRFGVYCQHAFYAFYGFTIGANHVNIVTQQTQNKLESEMKRYTLEQAKQAFFNEDATALAVYCDEALIEKLATWLENNDYDSDYAWRLYDMGEEEMRYLKEMAAEEFAEFL